MYRVYDLPSIADLVRYFHAAAAYPVRSTWLNSIKAVNYESWPIFTYNYVARYFPSAYETIKGHMVQIRQGIGYTRKTLLDPPKTPDVIPEKDQADKPTQ